MSYDSGDRPWTPGAEFESDEESAPVFVRSPPSNGSSAMMRPALARLAAAGSTQSRPWSHICAVCALLGTLVLLMSQMGSWPDRPSGGWSKARTGVPVDVELQQFGVAAPALPMAPAPVALPLPPLPAWLDAAEISLAERALAATPRRHVLEYGSGWSTFSLHRMLEETQGHVWSVQHSLEACGSLLTLASEAGVSAHQIEIFLVGREESSGDLVSTPLVTRQENPEKPRIHVYCIPPTPGLPPSGVSSWVSGVRCPSSDMGGDGGIPDGFRCPTQMAWVEEYVRMPSFFPLLQRDGRVPRALSERMLGKKPLPSPALQGDDALKHADASVFPLANPAAMLPPHIAAGQPEPPPPIRFDFVLVKGRARPQAAWFNWHLLARAEGGAPDVSAVVIHDTDERPFYTQSALQVYDAVESLTQNTHPGSKGMVLLRRKDSTAGRMQDAPRWWLQTDDGIGAS